MNGIFVWTGREQLILLGRSCLFGVALGFLFDFFNLPAKSRRCRWWLAFVLDVSFFAVTAIATFYFSLAVMDGQMHPSLFVGSALGICAQHLLIGRFWGRLMYRTARFAREAFLGIFGRLSSLFKGKIFAFFHLLLRLRRKSEKNAEKAQKN